MAHASIVRIVVSWGSLYIFVFISIDQKFETTASVATYE